MSSSKDAAAAHTFGEPSHGHPELAQNKSFMSVTPDVAHLEMWPYVASALDGLSNQAVTAAPMLVSSMTHPPDPGGAMPQSGAEAHAGRRRGSKRG